MSHQDIFEGIAALTRAGKEADPVTLAAHLDAAENHYQDATSVLGHCGGMPYLLQLLEATPTPSRIDDYCDLLEVPARARQIIAWADTARALAMQGESGLTEIAAGNGHFNLSEYARSAARTLVHPGVRMADVAREAVDWIWHGWL